MKLETIIRKLSTQQLQAIGNICVTAEWDITYHKPNYHSLRLGNLLITLSAEKNIKDKDRIQISKNAVNISNYKDLNHNMIYNNIYNYIIQLGEEMSVTKEEYLDFVYNKLEEIDKLKQELLPYMKHFSETYKPNQILDNFTVINKNNFMLTSKNGDMSCTYNRIKFEEFLDNKQREKNRKYEEYLKLKKEFGDNENTTLKFLV